MARDIEKFALLLEDGPPWQEFAQRLADSHVSGEAMTGARVNNRRFVVRAMRANSDGTMTIEVELLQCT